MHPVQKAFIKNGMVAILTIMAFSARRKWLNWLTKGLTNALANTTIASKRIKQTNDLDALGKMWQRGFPSSKQVPITGQDLNTVYAEIHTPCPLRGSGDTQACYRMMAYDRKIVDKAGGQFVVLQSQATPSNTYCKVAMRPKGAAMDDLKEAHR